MMELFNDTIANGETAYGSVEFALGSGATGVVCRLLALLSHCAAFVTSPWPSAARPSVALAGAAAGLGDGAGAFVVGLALVVAAGQRHGERTSALTAAAGDVAA